MEYSNEFLERAHRFSFGNRTLVMQSTACICFYCLGTFDPSNIIEWIDDKDADTAMCPLCGIDAVIPSKSELPINDPQFIQQMRTRYFW